MLLYTGQAQNTSGLELILSPEELSIWRAKKNGQRRREWLLGRLSAKILIWIWLGEAVNPGLSRSSEPDFEQLEVWLGVWLGLARKIKILPNDRTGAPEIDIKELGFEGWPPDISLSHTSGLVAARVSAFGSLVGLDVEKSNRVLSDRFLKWVFTPGELLLWKPNDKKAPLIAWCAKEAAAKACKTGIIGYLNSFGLVDLAFDEHFVEIAFETTKKFKINFTEREGYILAWL